MEWDWTNYLVDGGTRPDAMTGLADPFEMSLQAMFAAAPPDVQAQLRIMSGYRSVERQAELWRAAVEKYGSEEAARKWVAPPGNSQHNHGMAADLRYLDPAAQEWVHQNAARFGLAFPLANEPWHVELMGARGGAGGTNPVNAFAGVGMGPATNALAAMQPQNAFAAFKPLQLDPQDFMTSRRYGA